MTFACEKRLFFMVDNEGELVIMGSEVIGMSDNRTRNWLTIVHNLVFIQSCVEEVGVMARILGMPKPILCQSFEEAEAFAVTKNRAVLVQVGEKVGRMTPNGDFRDLREAMEIVAKAVERNMKTERSGSDVPKQDEPRKKP